MRKLPAEHVAKYLEWHMAEQGINTANGPALAEIIPVLSERAKTLKELAATSRYFYEEFETYDEKAAAKNFKLEAIAPLAKLLEKLTALTDWTVEVIHDAMNQTATELEIGMGKVGMPFRLAVTGSGQSPSMDITAKLVGRERTLARVQKAIEHIQNQA